MVAGGENFGSSAIDTFLESYRLRFILSVIPSAVLVVSSLNALSSSNLILILSILSSMFSSSMGLYPIRSTDRLHAIDSEAAQITSTTLNTYSNKNIAIKVEFWSQSFGTSSPPSCESISSDGITLLSVKQVTCTIILVRNNKIFSFYFFSY